LADVERLRELGVGFDVDLDRKAVLGEPAHDLVVAPRDLIDALVRLPNRRVDDEPAPLGLRAGAGLGERRRLEDGRALHDAYLTRRARQAASKSSRAPYCSVTFAVPASAVEVVCRIAPRGVNTSVNELSGFASSSAGPFQMPCHATS